MPFHFSRRLIRVQHDVIYPEYKKFFDSHPALEGDAAKVTVRLVPKADVIEYACAYGSRGSYSYRGSDGKKTYLPKPENKSVRDAPSKAQSHARKQFLSLTESANTRRKSVMLDEELERARLDAETEARRRKRMSREAKEEEQLRIKYASHMRTPLTRQDGTRGTEEARDAGGQGGGGPQAPSG